MAPCRHPTHGTTRPGRLFSFPSYSQDTLQQTQPCPEPQHNSARGAVSPRLSPHETPLLPPRHFSHVRLFATPWTIAYQAPLPMGFPRQEYWSGLSCPPLGDLPDPGIEHASLTSPALAGEFFTTSAIWEAPRRHWSSSNYW